MVCLIEIGLWCVLEDGFFDNIFISYYWEVLLKVDIGNCKVFYIDNFLLLLGIFFDDKVLWFDLEKYILNVNDDWVVYIC